MIKKGTVYRPEQAEHHFLIHIAFAPKWFIDCGPGNGGEALRVREKYPKISLLGIEPSPVGFAEASRLWAKMKDTTLLPLAVWDVPDETIDLYGASDLLHSTVFYKEGKSEIPLKVRTTSIDYLDGIYHFEDAILWMDIEGAEQRALQGAKKVFERGAIKAVNLEVRPETEKEIHAILKGYGLRKVSEYLVCETYKDEVWLL